MIYFVGIKLTSSKCIRSFFSLNSIGFGLVYNRMNIMPPVGFSLGTRSLLSWNLFGQFWGSQFFCLHHLWFVNILVRKKRLHSTQEWGNRIHWIQVQNKRYSGHVPFPSILISHWMFSSWPGRCQSGVPRRGVYHRNECLYCWWKKFSLTTWDG